jgi:hypothetical protein
MRQSAASSNATASGANSGAVMTMLNGMTAKIPDQ